MLRLELRSFAAANAAHNSSRRRVIPLLVSGAALMAGAIASPGAQAQSQCSGNGIQEYFPFGNGGGVNALTSVIGTVNTAFLTNGSAYVSAPGNPASDQQGGGVWTREIAGKVDTEANSTFNGSFNITIPPGTTGTYPPGTYPFPAQGNCKTKVEQDFVGFQAGQDIAVLNGVSTGANIHFGATAGYVQSSAKDVSPGGTFAGNFQVPFAGVYTVYTKGNFFADGQARLDYFQGELNDPLANGIFNQRLDARGYAFTGNAGYRFDLADKWFVEPSVGGVFSRVNVDSLDLAGTMLIPGQSQLGSAGVTIPGSVKINDIESELGRASLRVGTTITSDGGLVIAQPFFTASVFHEFAGNVTASVSAPPTPNITATGALTASRVGTYAQFGLGSSFQLVNMGWLGYGRVDYRTGDNIQGVSVNAGLRYQLNAAPAGLKDEESFKDGPPSRTGYNWTGPYLGASVGETWGAEKWRYVTSHDTVDPDFAGYLAGGQAGYNYQIGRFVTGIEGDFGASNARGVKSCPNKDFYGCEANLDQLGSLTARLGYTWGRALFYAKGGWAFGEVTAQSHLNIGSPTNAPAYQLFTNVGPTNAAPIATAAWIDGWTVGGGMEFALTDRWSAKAEYMHYELGKFGFAPASAGESAEAATEGDTVRVGVNYHFNR